MEFELKGDLKCFCGFNFFSATPIFQTIPDGRTFEMASTDGSVKFLWRMECLRCKQDYIMTSKPREQGNKLTLLRDYDDNLTPALTKEAAALIDARAIDPVAGFGQEGQEA
jgi:hypothetical protein